jgi:hypothetical protein
MTNTRRPEREAALGQLGQRVRASDVRFWHLADIGTASENVRFRG